ncbi:DUF4262 domain-containing protein [Aeromicrobium sp.]|uniref:DUF4262 domain-containing protein n=1 Tax=Aeromicrobium sp. TaxID=1871063 RepID=UPI002FCBCDE7
MCWKCDNPNATDTDYLRLIQEKISTYGWFIQFVEKDRRRPPFAYTVGLTPIGHPELLITGLAPKKSGPMLNSIAHGLMSHDDAPYVAGDRHVWPDGLTIEVVDVAEPTVHLVMANATYGPDLHAVQLVYADDRGRWPWQVGFRGVQPVLGPRADIGAAP